MRVLLIASLLGFATASCPADCSGHGACGRNDKCTCYANWDGIDCAQRMCPYGVAWVGTTRTYLECSNRGVCDRKTGECSCDEGYTGSGCRRTTCPNDCSGHGTCETMTELASDASMAAGGKGYNSYSLWDDDKTRGCKCDARYGGIDCSERMCPKGDDPITKEVDIFQVSATSLQVNEVQNVTVQKVTAPINGGEVTFTYTDMYNGVWTTRPVALPLVKTWSNKNGHMSVNQFNWVDTGKTMATIATTKSGDATTGYYYAHVLSGAWTAATGSYSCRKGDKLLISDSRLYEGFETCLLTVFEDCAASTALKVVADPVQPACGITASTTAKLYTPWRVLQTQGGNLDGTAKEVTARSSNTLTIDSAVTGASVTTTQKSLLSQLAPGTWIRLYDETAAGGEYCDYQVNAFPTAAGTTSISVNAASATSTKQDEATGVGNAYGSVACGQFSGKTYAVAFIEQGNVLAAAETLFPVIASANKFAVAQVAATSTAVKKATITRVANAGGAKNFDAREAGSLAAGSIFVLYDATATISYKCVGMVESYTANVITVVDAPAASMGGATLTQCTDTTLSSAIALAKVYASNAIVYTVGADDTTVNANYFDGISAGDHVSLTLSNSGNQDVPTMHVDRVDTTSSNSKAIFFSFGSAPNGGGMYDILPHHTTWVAQNAEFQMEGFTTSLPKSAVLQASWNSAASTTYLTTDAAYTNSAKDVERVLEELPNQVVSDVSVSMTAASLGSYAYTVSFAGTRDTGDQHAVVMNSKGCDTDGCQPRYSGVRIQQSFSLNAYDTAPIIPAAQGVSITASTTSGLNGMVKTAGATTNVIYLVDSKIGAGYGLVQVATGECRPILTAFASTATTWPSDMTEWTVTHAAFTADFNAATSVGMAFQLRQAGCGGVTVTTSGMTAGHIEVGLVAARVDSTNFIVDVGADTIAVGDTFCVAGTTACNTVSAVAEYQPSKTAAITNDVGPKPGNTYVQDTTTAQGIILGCATGMAQTGIDAQNWIVLENSGTIGDNSPAVTNTNTITVSAGTGAAPTNAAAAAAGNGGGANTKLNRVVSYVTLAGGLSGVTYAADDAYSKTTSKVYIKRDADSSRVNTAGGDTVVLYQDAANNGKSFGTLGTQADTALVFEYNDATAATLTSGSGVLVLKANGDYSTTDKTTLFKSETYEITRGTTEATECSGRGRCDGESGICECYKGYTGQACQTQTVLL